VQARQDAGVRGFAIVAAAVAALAFAQAAFGHVTVDPAFLALGEEATLRFDAPNERDRLMTALELVTPEGLVLVSAQAPPGWQADVTGDRVEWTGNTLAPDATARFAARFRATGSPGSVSILATQRFEDGASVRWRPTLTLVPGVSDSPDQHLGRAVLAAVVGLAVIAGSLLLVHRARRRTLQEQ
jgi:uncharacterized protein YcnI